MLTRDFFDRPVLDVARELLGCVVVSRLGGGEVRVRLTEVEAYDGSGLDPGSHAFRGPTRRNQVMFGEPGHLYVYFSYGMHWCANIVCREPGHASAVLLRAGEVVSGHELASERRPACRTSRDLARGPARLAAALGLTGEQDGVDLCGPGPLTVLPADTGPGSGLGPGPGSGSGAVSWGPRVGVSGEGGVREWRCWVQGDPTVSVYRAAVSRRRPADKAGAGGDSDVRQ